MSLLFPNVITKTSLPDPSQDEKNQLSFMEGAYFDFISVYGGAEGWFGNQYIKFWEIGDVCRLNVAYRVSEYIQDICLIGSDRCGNAFGTNTRNGNLIKIPFIPLDLDFTETTFRSFSDFVKLLESSELDREDIPTINPETFDKEVFEKHPVVLGGDPNDSNNKSLITNEEHVEAVVFFNEIVRKVKEQSR